MKLKQFLTFILILMSAVSSLSWAADEAAAYQEGKQFKRIVPKVPTETGTQAEVVELFWYGCSHCYTMETHINKWLKTKPATVTFRRVPAIFSPKWEIHARAYYAAEALGILEKAHPVIFETIHELKNKLENEEDIKKLFTQFGVDEANFKKAFQSFAVEAKVNRAKELTRRYGIDSVPTLVVQGQYQTDNGLTGDPTKTMQVVQYLTTK